MSRPQRQCIFCDNGVNSKEHFWPEWMHPLLPKRRAGSHGSPLYSYHPDTGTVISGKTDRQGDVRTTKVRAVCKACNNGWMNRLEGKARPLLRPLIAGEPLALDHRQMRVVAQWIALKCMVLEHAKPNLSLTPRPDRIALADNGIIPSYFRIYLANHNLEDALWAIRHSHCRCVEGGYLDPPLNGATRNVQTISFVIGRIFIHLNAARVADFAIEDSHSIEPFHQRSLIWPQVDFEMVWPRRPLLDLAGLRTITTTLDTILDNSRVRWIGGPNDPLPGE